MSHEEERKFKEELEKLGVAEVNKKLRMGHYGAYTTQRNRFAQLFVDEAVAKQQQEYDEQSINLLREANKKSHEANTISQEANEISLEANKQAANANYLSKIAILLSIISAIISVIAVIYGHN